MTNQNSAFALAGFGLSEERQPSALDNHQQRAGRGEP